MRTDEGISTKLRPAVLFTNSFSNGFKIDEIYLRESVRNIRLLVDKIPNLQQ